MTRSNLLGLVTALGLAFGLAAQDTPGTASGGLTLYEAAEIALREHPAMEAVEARQDGAAASIEAAKAGRLPRIALEESYMRSNNPVFAFGTLLNQRRFGEENFAITSLNNPDSVQNFQSLLRVEQVLFDAGRTKQAIRLARLQTELTSEERRRRESEVLLGVVRTYFAVALAAGNREAARETLASAEADLANAKDRLQAGMTTRADVLALEVFLAEAKQQQIAAKRDEEIAAAALNEALGLDQSTPRAASTPLVRATPPTGGLDDYLARAAEHRPDLDQARIVSSLAEARTAQAKSALFPQVVAQGLLEADKGRFVDQAGGNWLVGAAVKWDVWNGGENRARLKASRFQEAASAALRRQASSRAELAVRRGWAEWQSAAEQLSVAESAVVSAEESLRIVKNRYEAGLENVTALVGAATSLSTARFRRLAALYGQRTARAALDHEAGVLTLASEAIQ